MIDENPILRLHTFAQINSIETNEAVRLTVTSRKFQSMSLLFGDFAQLLPVDNMVLNGLNGGPQTVWPLDAPVVTRLP